MPKNNVIGVYSLTNTASLNVYEVNDFMDYVIAGINDDEPEKCPIDYELEPEDVNDMRLGFFFGEMFVPFDEVLRIDA